MSRKTKVSDHVSMLREFAGDEVADDAIDEMEDDFTHYFNATGRLSRRVADLERQMADKRTVPLETLRRLAALLEYLAIGGPVSSKSRCSWCGQDTLNGGTHAPDCDLAALRGALEGLLR